MGGPTANFTLLMRIRESILRNSSTKDSGTRVNDQRITPEVLHLVPVSKVSRIAQSWNDVGL